MLEFEAKFARYDSRKGESRLSSPQFFVAEDFRGAVKIAEAILTGLRGDLDREYRLIDLKERGSGGIDCSGGGVGMFETAEEFSARVAEKGER